MQERGLPASANVVGGFARHAIGLVDVQPVAPEVFQPRPILEARRDPACRCLGRNADAVVLADEQKRQRDRLVGRPLRRIERTLRGRMVGRGVAERAHRRSHRPAGAMFRPVTACGADRIGRANGLGQVAGDGRGLRRDIQRPGAQHLVPAARDRVLGRRRKG